MGLLQRRSMLLKSDWFCETRACDNVLFDSLVNKLTSCWQAGLPPRNLSPSSTNPCGCVRTELKDRLFRFSLTVGNSSIPRNYTGHTKDFPGPSAKIKDSGTKSEEVVPESCASTPGTMEYCNGVQALACDPSNQLSVWL